MGEGGELQFYKNIYKTKRLTWRAGGQAAPEPLTLVGFLVVVVAVFYFNPRDSWFGASQEKTRDSLAELRGGGSRSSSAPPRRLPQTLAHAHAEFH